MYYFIEKSNHAPSGIALILSFNRFTKRTSNSNGYVTYYPEDYTVIHNEVEYLGGEIDDLLGNGVDRSKIILDPKNLIVRLFK